MRPSLIGNVHGSVETLDDPGLGGSSSELNAIYSAIPTKARKEYSATNECKLKGERYFRNTTCNP